MMMRPLQPSNHLAVKMGDVEFESMFMNNYIDINSIGQGTFGHIYSAISSLNTETVAVKLIELTE